MRNASEPPVFVPAHPHLYWLVKVEGFRAGLYDTFADGTPSAYHSPNTTAGVVDTGTSMLYIPSSIFSTFISTVFVNESVSYQGGNVLGPCDPASYRSFSLYINGSYFEVTPQSFILDYNTGVPNLCILTIGESSQNFWLMGDTFIRNYFTIFDEETATVGFAPSVTSKATIYQNQTLTNNTIILAPSAPSNIDTYRFEPLQIMYLTAKTYGLIGVFAGSLLRMLFGIDLVTPTM